MVRCVAFVCLSLLIAEGLTAAGTGVGTGSSRKQLPLDAVPNVVLKSRENSTYLNDRLIVKLMPGAGIEDVLAGSPLSVANIRPMFRRQMIERNTTSIDLSRFYVVTFGSSVDAFSVAEELSGLHAVQYAEPWYTYPLDVDPPNDPQFASQYGLTKIQAPQAWDVSQGDTNVVIGIVDTGVEVNHPDLSGNIWHNPGEVGLDGSSNDKRTNGVDDDANGFVDDWQGWDFAGADYNNPIEDNNPSPVGSNTEHGTHVAGIASATTNNLVGVAGTGFKCRLLAIKTSADNDTRGPGGTAYLIAGYEGVAYAAFMGADVMNCSWGGSGGSQTEQEVINYATQVGTLVVAAAGNSGSSSSHYPSAYNNVISVVATNSSDVKAGFSNYGRTVDVCAPGVSILSTIYPSTYTSGYSGTSMASPFAAGVAGLVKAVNPGYGALQVGEQVRVTSDNIDASNPSFVGLIGKGRINAFKALTTTSPSIRSSRLVIRDSVSGNNNGVPEPNETLDIYLTFTNYLAASTNASVTLSVTGAGLTVTQGVFAIGVLNTSDTLRNTGTSLRVQLASNVAPGLVAQAKLTYTDGTYSDFEYFSFVVNPTYQSHNVNLVVATMANNGRLGFNDFPNNLQGRGFIYPAATDSNHLFEGGIIIGTSSTRVVNNVRNPGGTQDNDFLARQIYQMQAPGIVSNQDGSTVYSDSSAPVGNRIGIKLNQYSYAYSSPDNDDYVITRYDITNLTATPITGLYIGQFYDWDIANYNANRTGLDVSRSLSYAWDNSNAVRPYMGVRALDTLIGARGLINAGGIVLDRAAKWGWISGGTGTASVGPGDIHSVISTGPINIGVGETKLAGFAILAGANLAALQANADFAKTKWLEILSTVSVREEGGVTPERFALFQNYPNPFNPETRINYHLAQSGLVTLKVFDVLGREVAILVDQRQDAGQYSAAFDGKALTSGVYYYQLKAGSFSQTNKMLLIK